MEPDETEHVAHLLDRARAGDGSAVNELLLCYREKLRRGLGFRMDPRLQGRLDASDVIQEAYVDVAKGLKGYLESEKEQLPFYLWLRTIAFRKLFALHRQHLGTRARDGKRDVSIYQSPGAAMTSACLAAQLVGKLTAASEVLSRKERQLKLQGALGEMDDLDREVLALRHFEQLSNAETAKVLAINDSTASSRYLRALKRLKKILTSEDS